MASATPEGTVQERLSVSAVRTDISGEWRPVDPTIVADPDTGKLKVASAVFDMSFDSSNAAEFLSMQTDQGTISMGAPTALGAPLVDGASVTWPLLDSSGTQIDGAVLTVTVSPDATSLTPIIEVRDRKAYDEVSAESGDSGVGFEVSTSADLKVVESAHGNGFEAVDPVTGETVFTGAKPVQWDSSGLIEPGVERVEGVFSPDAQQSISDTEAPMDINVADDQTIVVSADETMINNSDTVWPVMIDPTLTGKFTMEYTAVRSAWPSKYMSKDNEAVGLCDVNLDSACQKDYKSRLLWQFSDISVLKKLSKSDVKKATFSVKGTHSYDCSDKSVQLHLMKSGISKNTTWDNQPKSADRLDSQYPSFRSNCDGPHYVKWDATSGVKDSVGSSSLTLSLLSPTEETMKTWRRFDQDTATLTIDYNRVPDNPTKLSSIANGTPHACSAGDSPDLIRSTTPIFSAELKDPDDQNVKADFELYRYKDAAWTKIWSKVTSAQKSGKEHSVTVPSGQITADGKYRWRVQAIDSEKETSGWAGWCRLDIDVTKPNPPTITPIVPTGANSPIKAVYAAGVESGGIGLTGCFRLGWNGSTDVVKFLYSFNSTSYNLSATPNASGTADVCLPSGWPSAAGPNYVVAKSTDLAGNASDEARHSYRVAESREDGVWAFDVPGQTTVPDLSIRDTGEAPPAGPLTVSAGTWVPGPHALFDSRDGDFALRFNGSSTQAATASPAIDTSQSFVVTAHVSLSSATSARTALSQDAGWSSAWSVGFQPSACGISGWAGGCWAFSMYATEGGSPLTVKSSVPAQAGRWTHLAAEYNALTDKMRLWTCDVGTPTVPSPGEPIATQANGPQNMWKASGVLVVGRAQAARTKTNWWAGDIDNVRIFRGQVLSEAKIRRLCQGAEANSFPSGANGIDPTVAGE